LAPEVAQAARTSHSTLGLVQISREMLSINFFSNSSSFRSTTKLSSTMSFLGSGASKSNEDIKTALLQQVQQEAAMNNARALIGVRHFRS
jgi:hypothetical protein